jgi:RNA polymerase sigma factor (sigma-70 family)
MDEKLQNAIKGSLNQDRRAQKALYDSCFSPMMAICLRYQKNREDAVSLLNEAFLKVLLNLAQYNPNLPFFTWVSTITVRTAIDAYRKNQRHITASIEEDDQWHQQDIAAAASNLRAEEILETIQKLPTSELLVFNLFEMEGYAHQEIAAQLEISERTSKRLLHNAKVKLKQWILNKEFVLF